MPTPKVSADDALQRLLAGNARYAAGEPLRPNQCAVRRAEVATCQEPFAAVIGCSDSRVPVEVIFDAGVGDLFVIRTAGNLVEDVCIASTEFAVLNLGVGLVMVMGHRRCGAVSAAVKATLSSEDQVPAPPTPGGGPGPASRSGYLPALVAKIQPAVDAVRHKPGDLMDHAVHANARAMAHRLFSRSTVIADAIRAGHLRIVAACYDLDTGRVVVLD